MCGYICAMCNARKNKKYKIGKHHYEIAWPFGLRFVESQACDGYKPKVTNEINYYLTLSCIVTTAATVQVYECISVVQRITIRVESASSASQSRTDFHLSLMMKNT